MMGTAGTVHGTDGGYFWHRRWGSVPCTACLDAHATRRMANRNRRQRLAEQIMGRPVPHREVAQVLGNYGP